eukprot:evm.model.scf_2709.2 EVM.evm.TU.scf_2709.2   scf_2709:6264-10187(+)
MTVRAFAPCGCGATFGLPPRISSAKRGRARHRRVVVRSGAAEAGDAASAGTKVSEPVDAQPKNSSNGFVKEDVGPLTGVTGGWPGGEKGLRMFVGDYKSDLSNGNSTGTANKMDEEGTVKIKVGDKKIRAKKVGPGKDAIYIGFNKDSDTQAEARRRGEMGAFIVDDARKYPAKEKFGILPGVTGGFAGGERGVQQFVSEGDINFLDPDDPRGRQNSPVVVATVVAVVGSVGGILLTDLFDVGKLIAGGEIVPASLDEDTKVLLEVAIGLLLFVLGGIASITALRAFGRKFRTMATKAAVAGGFWLCVFLIAYEIMRA